MEGKVGDRVFVETKDKKMEGILMPSNKDDSIVLKLDSGYNLGVLKKKVKSVKVLKNFKEKKVKLKEHKPSKNKKKVCILHTGGTIASKVDYETGGVVAKFKPEEILSMFPELEKLANVDSKLVRNMVSEDMRFEHYNLLAKAVEKEVKKGVDGIIITHGTDTMHYTSAALSFVLENLNVPVLLVGAQRSSDRGSSDAAMNLICAVEFIVNSKFHGVGICMHKNADDDVCWILPGLKSRKLHSSRRDAFKPINAKAIAEINYKTRSVKMLEKEKEKSNEKLKLKLFKEVKVGIVKAYPNMFADQLKVFEKYNGLVLIGTGLGHMPITEIDDFTKENKKILDQIKKLVGKMPVVMSPQTIFGRIDMNVYSPGRTLLDIGVIGNLSDMTPETSYIKLAWLLSNYPKEVKEMYMENLRGEFNERIGEEFL
ncbi:Glu-tRNA(Gln) amidotransferase subunit GatD [archaeon]|jgi:glutamyl-tRNA(Gln) amidotransferase subunit D|nr:Glu-tRNA(Gln) amidotransferase subunit GatD [archaeon]MBT3730717.1 Glu-tRNA(Gln) amidotransferase subunit GatD [archaeon]MBT4669619.1 Glu-tRNA(Gln) amidotransferase subunit GatD [archaeon]MBT5030376.1 Glu-tRNA(Gln) amidotransferase subunit GatD [archaeon]MBT5288331.1 Glu-tRNA(Gln) amidotransferase subunit GatD [archaeon]